MIRRIYAYEVGEGKFIFDILPVNKNNWNGLSGLGPRHGPLAGWDDMKRYAVYRTASAPASRAIGSVALTIAVTAFLAKRFGMIDADVFVLSLACAAFVALAAILVAALAFHRIWTYGGPGVPSALAGMLFGVVALGPPVLVLGMLVADPGSDDVSTDTSDPPVVKTQAVEAAQPFLNWTTAVVEEKMWPLVSEISQTGFAAARRADTGTDDIVPRRYRIAPGQLHVAGAKALDNLSWSVVDELPPDLLDAATRLQAEGTTQVLGLKFDVALRIRPDRVGALLDVRSRSRSPLRDLSDNAAHVRAVFSEIDRVLLETYGELARLSVEETETDEEFQPEPIEEPRDVVPVPGFKPYFEEEGDALPGEADPTDLAG